MEDRLQKIRSTIEKYGEGNFYMSFSGGKDSTVLSAILDMAIPGNTIPRVYANTGIEYRMITKFVEDVKSKEHSWELIILKPTIPIKDMLERDGYPFKSKKHAKKLGTYQRNGWTKTTQNYLYPSDEVKTFACPKKLRYQFSEDFKLKVDYKCCVNLKEKPLNNWAKENNKPYGIVGIMKDEGGSRTKGKCMAYVGNKLKNFQPLIPITKKWENWFIEKYKIEISDIYKEPYNFTRTGCKGCPFAMQLQKELDVLEKYFPDERKQCEIIWKPVYEEYRRIGYRLKPENYMKKNHQITIEEWLEMYGGCA